MTFWLRRVVCAFVAGLCPLYGFGGDAGVTDTEIKLGRSAVLTGPLSAQTAAYGRGAQYYFDKVNAAGGVAGRKISYISLDDGFEVEKTLENTRKLINDERVFALFNGTGTANTAAVLPLAVESKTIVFAPVTGATALRETYNRHLFHVRASYASEAERITMQLQQVGVSRVAVLYQDDPLGNALLKDVRKAASGKKLELLAVEKIDPKSPDFAASAGRLEKANPQAVVMASAGSTFTGFVKAVQATALRPVFYGFSIVSVDGLNRDLGKDARGIVLAQIMPSLRSFAVPVVNEYLEVAAAKNAGAAPSASEFEGFVQAKLFVEGLRRTGRKLTTDSFIKTMESAGPISFGKFSAQYSSSSHEGSSFVEMAIVEVDGRLRY